jgi:hypothetical protein
LPASRVFSQYVQFAVAVTKEFVVRGFDLLPAPGENTLKKTNPD